MRVGEIDRKAYGVSRGVAEIRAPIPSCGVVTYEYVLSLGSSALVHASYHLC